jgi:hypothetical protein
MLLMRRNILLQHTLRCAGGVTLPLRHIAAEPQPNRRSRKSYPILPNLPPANHIGGPFGGGYAMAMSGGHVGKRQQQCSLVNFLARREDFRG